MIKKWLKDWKVRIANFGVSFPLSESWHETFQLKRMSRSQFLNCVRFELPPHYSFSQTIPILCVILGLNFGEYYLQMLHPEKLKILLETRFVNVV